MRQTAEEPVAIALARATLLQEQSAADETMFRRILDHLPAAVYATDSAGRITYYNQAAVDLWGCAPELMKSEWCGSWKLFWPDGRPMKHSECPMAIAVRSKKAIRGTEAIAERPDGTRVVFMPFPTPLLDDEGVLVGAVNLLVDITERRRDGDHARRLASIVEYSDDAIISESLDGIIESWNRGAERLLGYTAEETLGRHVSMLTPPDRRDEGKEIIARICKGESVDHYETVRQHKDGRAIDVSLTLSPVFDEHGRIVAASKIARDITDRRKVQEQQKLVLAEMKHRIKNTLSTVQGIARQTLKSASPEERNRFLERLRTLAEAHDLLTHENWDRAPLSEVVRRALGPFQDMRGERVSIAGPEDVWLTADKSLHLTMVLHELATNAVKYGALSNAKGKVSVVWSKRRNGGIAMVWKESGGPVVHAPEHAGFGSRLIDRTLSGLGRGRVRYAPAGLTCVLLMSE
ncbi:MAG: PAS domain S-box protein [Alphaproteobacteria bacterium]|nr:PAS domain S-box protein [Alphaproteobacteria bacterium]